jgi:DNA-binding GntR family transcriptional regulator
MSANEILRERARAMVAAGMTDQQVDQAIMYSDAAVRLEIWRYVLECRTAAPPAARGSTGRDDVPADEVMAELSRRAAAGAPTSYGALARHFHVSPTTIRRRLGKIP